MSDRIVTTYSMWNLFRNCRKAAHWRYVLQFVPLEKDHNLSFGSLIHECLEHWHKARELAAVLDLIDRACANRGQDEEQRRVWHVATAMMKGYAARYAQEEFEVVALEKAFEGEIVNPETGACSRTFTLAGKVDGIVRNGADHFLLEHKTAAAVDASYLERLWTDFQITLYAHYLEQVLGIRIVGVLYNVLVKARLQQSEGETEVEFEARRAELIAKSKTGKSSAKRRMPETDEEFQARLAAKYAEPGSFHRETLYLSRDQFDTLRAELWELTQAFLDARRRDVWYQNTSFCFQYGRPCPYFALCRSGGSQNVLDNFYRRQAPNEELQSGSPSDDAPVF
ncbi:MAG: PD-(D/E)XK nuclease family protein [Deltaproteobacteria bacterium]|nr:PD-(D/E)XK nuclease family protein [Deltaproteobacteria bacterium]